MGTIETVTVPLIISKHNFDALVEAHDLGESITVFGISLMPSEAGVRLIVLGSNTPENEERGFKAVEAS